MKSAIDAALALALTIVPASAEGLREKVLREAALDAGLMRVETLNIPVDPALAEAGRLLFQSRSLSLNHASACASCHLDRFGSADGLPVAIGAGGRGEGAARMAGGGDVVPRNTLPLWGRGGEGFDVLFWDGKVSVGPDGAVLSQFGPAAPSDDPLTVAVHLPPVEIDEMLSDSRTNDVLEQESVATAETVYAQLAQRIAADPEFGPELASAREKDVSELEFRDIAAALAAFIRGNFALQPTRFHRFVFESEALTDQELAGGLLFYGKGGCAGCHNGPYFSDLAFHAIPFPQYGFGRNGFGVDYGRFNVTLDPADRGRFRTPPLFNVAQTGPYSHSGAVSSLREAILAHVDPLAQIDGKTMSPPRRAEFYQRLAAWTDEPLQPIFLDALELDALEAFLGALSFMGGTPIAETR